MVHGSMRAGGCARIVALAVVLCVLGASTAVPAQRQTKAYEDDDYGFRVAYPGGDWKRGFPGIVFVPGELCRVWSASPTTSIAVFMQKPGGPVTARFLADESAESMKKSLGVKVSKQEVRRVAGMQAMSLIVSGKGTGSALDGQGEVPTTQHWIAVPREEDILVLLLSASESEFKAADQVLESMVKSLKVEGKQTDEQKESK